MKKPNLIAASDVPHAFSKARVFWMAREAGYTLAKQPDFAMTVQEAVLELLENLGKPTSNRVHHEIDELVRAAVRATRARKRPGYWCEQVARLREQLSPPAEKIMDRRGTLPDATMLRDPATQLDACHAILGAGSLGISHEQGRIRGKDKEGKVKRSETEVRQVYAPKLQERPLRHEPLIIFAERLLNAHLRAAGKLPATTNRQRPNSFARFLQRCLDAAGTGASAIKLLETRHWRRQVKQEHQKRLNVLIERWDAVMHSQILRLARRRILDAAIQRYRLSGPRG